MTATSQQTGAWLEAFTAQQAVDPWMQALRDDAFGKRLDAVLGLDGHDSIA
jgi:hypothetical protein